MILQSDYVVVVQDKDCKSEPSSSIGASRLYRCIDNFHIHVNHMRETPETRCHAGWMEVKKNRDQIEYIATSDGKLKACSLAGRK